MRHLAAPTSHAGAREHRLERVQQLGATRPATVLVPALPTHLDPTTRLLMRTPTGGDSHAAGACASQARLCASTVGPVGTCHLASSHFRERPSWSFSRSEVILGSRAS